MHKKSGSERLDKDNEADDFLCQDDSVTCDLNPCSAAKDMSFACHGDFEFDFGLVSSVDQVRVIGFDSWKDCYQTLFLKTLSLSTR